MGSPETVLEIPLEVADFSGQRVVSVSNASPDSSVSELISELVSKMNLPQNDSAGAPLTYAARLEREGRHLNASEKLGAALQPHDRLVLQPNIDAGLS